MKIYLVIGYPIKHSLSPLLHNTGYKSLGFDDKFIYKKKEVKPKQLKAFIDKLKKSDIKGISVTIPHKEMIMRYLDEIHEDGKKIGAINTVVNNEGKLIGFNTDWKGAIKALEKMTNLKRKKVIMFGAGGTARAILYGLKKRGAVVKIFNRSKEKGQDLAKEFGCDFGSFDCLGREEADIIINATSVGMNNDEQSPIDKNLIQKDQIIFDVVYTPKETKLIRAAQEKGAKVVYGYEMLLYQAVEQFKLFTGFAAPQEAMRKALEESL